MAETTTTTTRTTTRTTAEKPRTVVFLHPDLGIGGAERLVVDAAVGLQKRGHRVVIFTSHCDPAHCFDEVRPGSGTLDVRVRGGSVVPPTVLGRLAIVCAIARQTHLLVQIWASGELAALRPTALFVDQLSAGLPLLRWVSSRCGSERSEEKESERSEEKKESERSEEKKESERSEKKKESERSEENKKKILFYCHFPDLLLVQGRQRWWKRLYRMPFDALEQWSMGFADAVAVNSRFTRGVVAETWPQLAAHTDLQVVYPCIEVGEDKEEKDKDEPVLPWGGMPFLLSINRFERKKDVGLAVRAFAGLPAGRRAGSRLVVAGGYDPRVAENVEYHRELDRLATDLGLRTATAKTMVSALGVPADVDVLFLLSVPSALKTVLLQAARLLVYTPAREHFGIVPLEAMLAGLPVLACDTGGPTETVVEDETGWLRPPADVAAWTTIMSRALPGAVDSIPDPQRARMAAAGRRRVRSQFAGTQMAARIDGIYDELDAAAGSGTKKNHRPPLPAGLLVVLAGLLGLVIALAVGLVRWAV